jgi:hypothetical protein
MRRYPRQEGSGSGARSSMARRVISVAAATVIVATTILVPSAPSWAIGAGTVTGVSTTSGGVAHAVRWNRDGVITRLPTLPGDDNGHAGGLNKPDGIQGTGHLGAVARPDGIEGTG